MKFWKRMAVLLLVGIGVAVVVGGLANLLDLSDATVYGLGGAWIALVVAFGVPWAFGLGSRPNVLAFQDRKEMHPRVAAVATYQESYWNTHSYGERVVFSEGLEQDRLSTDDPREVPAGRTRQASSSFAKRISEPVGVGQVFSILDLNGAGK